MVSMKKSPFFFLRGFKEKALLLLGMLERRENDQRKERLDLMQDLKKGIHKKNSLYVSSSNYAFFRRRVSLKETQATGGGKQITLPFFEFALSFLCRDVLKRKTVSTNHPFF